MALLARSQCSAVSGDHIPKSYHAAKLAGETVLSEVAICWGVSAFSGSLRMLASVSRSTSITTRQLKPIFRTQFAYILASTRGSRQSSAGVRWQFGTGTWESL